MLPRSAAAHVQSELAAVRGLAPGALAAIAIGACLAILLAAYWSTFTSMVAVWMRSGTHAHGFVVAPIALWLAWRQRAALATCAVAPSALALVALLGLGLLWLLSGAALARVTEQLAVIAMIPTIVVCIAGLAVLRTLRFPFVYLIFMVPFGEPLIAPLSELTATMTVSLLRYSGIDVFREGLYFSTKVGDFEVARSCSGIRYLTASLAVGALFAHLSFRTLRYKLLFIALCLVTPVIANGVRAYLIVVLAHASNMSIAVDVDHIVYGWLFFGLVMLGLFWIGHFMRKAEARTAARTVPAAASLTHDALPATATHTALMFLATAVALLAAPLFARQLEGRAVRLAVDPALPRIAGDWSGPNDSSGLWAPEFHGAFRLLLGSYRHADASVVESAVISYSRQTEDAELIGYENRLVDVRRWRVLARTERTVALGDGRALRVSETVADSTGRGVQRVIWSLYRIGDRRTASAYFGKAMQGINSLFYPAAGAALIVFSSEDVDAENARAHLERFLTAHYEAAERCVDRGREAADSCVATADARRGNAPP